ncbi:MAG: ABC transporter ATP-binding protein [Propionibacteriaceae bacterium]|nr:ABC transporter ATP-binding protein [Propionibacteriaceae bacterium]
MLQFESVTKTYPDGTKAVTDLDLVIPSDGITVLVGPSGCGKTTILRMINRMIEPTSGRILWDDEPIKSIRRTTLRRQMGYVIQNGGLFPHKTVLENIGTVPDLLGWDDHKTLLRSRQLLEQVGLEARLGHRFPAQLSGGQQQRVGVARALAADPVLLLMDEPFSAVDPIVRAELRALVKTLQRELNKTIVIITHDMEEAIDMGDQIAVLRPGGILAQFGTPEEILDDPADEFVANFVGKERGYRSLAFAETPKPRLGPVRTVRNAASAFQGTDDRTQPVLVVDATGHPEGWADAERPGRVMALGETFQWPGAPLRDLVEAALTSPVGRAVAVDATGRYLGVLTSAEVMAQVQNHRADLAAHQREREEAAERAEAEREAAEREAAEQAEEEREAVERAEAEPAEPGARLKRGFRARPEASPEPGAAAKPEASLEPGVPAAEAESSPEPGVQAEPEAPAAAKPVRRPAEDGEV